jgi:uncharacterized protein
LSRKQLADKLGINLQTIGYIERGDYNPSLELALTIAQFFRLPVGDLQPQADAPAVCGGFRRATDRSAPGRLKVSAVPMSVAVSTLRVMPYFAVRLVHSTGWDSVRPIRGKDAWDDHAAFMDALVDDGFIVLGGPVGDGEQTLHVVEATDESEVRARLAADPWAKARLLQIGSIEAWALWLDSRPARGPR